MSAGERDRGFGQSGQPVPIAAANRIGRLASAIGIGGGDLTVDGVCAEARRKTRLRDFGDEAFLEPLAVLLESINREAALSPVGRMIIRGRLVSVLVNKLIARDAVRRFPEIRDIAIEPPIVIAGLARTGTTMLHRLIAADDAIRSLAAWEAFNPAPPPRRAFFGARKDARYAQTVRAARALKYMSPGFFAVHPAEPGAPEEEVILLEQSFLTTTPEAMMHVPTYSRWLEGQDHLRAYRTLERMLQYLQWQRPGSGKNVTWVLKTPHHQEYLDPLLEVFPDATIVHTHRDPLKTAPSLFSMLTHLQRIFSDQVQPSRVARHWLDKIERMAGRAMATRERVGDRGFIDVSYYDLLEDPIREVERIYEAAGRKVTHAARSAMEASRKVNTQHKYGRHQYSLEDFDVTEDDIESRMGRYRARYGVPYE